MPRTSVRNDTDSMLCLWLEPWGSDHWMHPGERLTVVAGDIYEPVDEPFEVNVHDQGISVWVNGANSAEVFDADGNEADCGHQRPVEAIRRWTENARQAVERVTDQPPQTREAASRHYELMRRMLDAAEAREPRQHDTDGGSSVPSSPNAPEQGDNPG